MKCSYNQIFNELSKASTSGRSMFVASYSKLNLKIVSLLLGDGIISGYQISSSSIKVYTKILENKPVIIKVNNVSKPGNRMYWSALKLKNMCYYKPGLYIIHTNKGLINNYEAIKYNLEIGRAHV